MNNNNNLKIEVPRDKLADFCRRNHIVRLSLFGSITKDNFGPESDIDVLVDFEKGHTPGFFRIFDLEQELSRLFNGRKVDLRTRMDLSRYFRDEVCSRAAVQYAAG